MYEVEERNPQVSVRRKRVSKGRKDIRRKRRIAKRMMNITFLFILSLPIMAGFISLAKENRKGTMSENGGTPYSTYSICSDSSKYYKTIVVRPGESLWSIAETYCTDDCRTLTDYIGVLKELNHLKGDTIYAGERILVVCQNYGD